MLLDTGADETLIPLHVLRAVGAPIGEETCEVGSWTREFRSAHVSSVDIQFGGGAFRFRTRVLAHDLVHVPVLGHRDFFERYVVKFDAGRRLFYVDEPGPIRVVG